MEREGSIRTFRCSKHSVFREKRGIAEEKGGRSGGQKKEETEHYHFLSEKTIRS